jgi:quercetin dioxygenase-like cupin family protein
MAGHDRFPEMTTRPSSTDSFLTKLHHRYATATAGRALAAELQALLAAWPADSDTIPPTPKRLPACDHLDAALVAGRSGPEAGLAEALSALSPALVWTYSYPARTGQPDLSAAVAFSQIVGPGGFRPSDQLRLGLTLIAPGTHYPPHAHPAIEIYLVIAGTAFWGLGGTAAAAQPPGALILHPSGMAHAMQTGTEPLLAIWSWRGDVTSPSVYL